MHSAGRPGGKTAQRRYFFLENAVEHKVPIIPARACCASLLSAFTVAPYQRIGRAVVIQLSARVFQFRNDSPGQGLAQLDAPLVE